ncbi:MAG: NAD(+) synthase [Clostridiales bacterium]|jgi:NAD+ synthase (glutamine-hydrolysing)|nr:NAD(+) synthase [Clostridiales bacterium]
MNEFMGYARIAAAAPGVRPGDTPGNAAEIIREIKRAALIGADVLVLPELCVTGYTCGDLFRQETLLAGATDAVRRIAAETSGIGTLVFVGLPVRAGGKLYNCAAALSGGALLGLIPKTHLPNYSEYYEARHFSPGEGAVREIDFAGRAVPFGTRLLFAREDKPDMVIATEICEDLWAPEPPSGGHARAGATVVVNLSAGDETTGKSAYRRALVDGQSGRLICAYAYAGAGFGESTQDMAFSGHCLISENGAGLAETPPFGKSYAVADADISALVHDRSRMTTFTPIRDEYRVVRYAVPEGWDVKEGFLRRADPRPFVPGGARNRAERCEEILNIQASGLAARLGHIRSKACVIGVSGGLDSTLALIVCGRAVRSLGDGVSVHALTLPCFGTTSRTKNNALRLCETMGVTCETIDISETVRAHLADIGLAENDRGVVYENAQARVRTLTLMDRANQVGGIVVGTGDLSELALGWATYNGDHMSMYAVNAGVPKTLVRHIIGHAADSAESPELAAVLRDIIDTPISPELLPPDDSGEIAQKTEDLIGPYDLTDFFLYHTLRFGRGPREIFRLAEIAFRGEFGAETILKWLETFMRRFFAQQFKRSCLPDGPKIGSVSLSPRGDWRMPSDASARLWLDEIEELKKSKR